MTNKDLENLNHMGKAWFVLRYYAEHLDPTEKRHLNCTSESLASRRENRFAETSNVHAELLLEVISTRNLKGINSNKLGVTSDEVIDMAKKSVLALVR